MLGFLHTDDPGAFDIVGKWCVASIAWAIPKIPDQNRLGSFLA